MSFKAMSTYICPAARRRTPRRASHTTTTRLQQHHSPTSRLMISTSLISSRSARPLNHIPSATRTLLQKTRLRMTTIVRTPTLPATFASSRTSPMELTLCDPSDPATSAHQLPRPTSVLHPLCHILPPRRTVSRSHTPPTRNLPTTDLYHQEHMVHTHRSPSILSPL